MKQMLTFLLVLLWRTVAEAQVYTGSSGSDGALDFGNIGSATNIVIDMHDHANGVYQYTYVNIPINVALSFITNANNSPVTWLVQSNVVVNGQVSVQGRNPTDQLFHDKGGPAGPGGWPGGDVDTVGYGPGGGSPGAGGGFGTPGSPKWGGVGGTAYGNESLIPLIGGSGGGGWSHSGQYSGGGGGGGAIMIAANGTIQLNGTVTAGGPLGFYSGGGSSGGIRLVASILSGSGNIYAGGNSDGGGQGRIRLDLIQNAFTGTIDGNFSQGSNYSLAVAVITNQPQDAYVLAGDAVTFTVGADGHTPFSYQWYFQGNRLAQGTNATLVIGNAQPNKVGSYRATVVDAEGTLMSSRYAALAIVIPGVDDDGDGISNQDEALLGTRPDRWDTDGDGISDYDEIHIYRTNPLLADTDGDGIPDDWEIQHGMNPLVNDANNEAGFVGVTYMQIYQYDLAHANQLDPQRPFSVGPGLSNYEIINSGQHTNRFYYDREDRLLGMESSRGISIAYIYDGNGNLRRQTVLPRAAETNGLPVLWSFLNGFTNTPDPYSDPDGDGWNNYQEWLAGTNPTNASNTPNLLGVTGATVGSMAPSFAVSNFVIGVGQMIGGGAQTVAVGGDGNPGAATNFVSLLTETATGWSTQRVDVGQFGITSLAIGQVSNRPSPAVYAGLRKLGGTGGVVELLNTDGVWYSSSVLSSTNQAAYVLGFGNGGLFVSFDASNQPAGGLYNVQFSNAWFAGLIDGTPSHRGLGTTTPYLGAGTLRLLDVGGVQITGFGRGTGVAAPSSGLAASYSLDGDANDDSGNNKSGTTVGGVAPTADRFGDSNRALSFSGSSFVDLSSNRPIAGVQSAFTISAWFNANSLSYANLVAHRANFRDISLGFSGSLSWSIYDNSGVPHSVSSQPLQSGVWYLATGTYDGTNQNLYVNGALVAASTWIGIVDWNANYLGDGIAGYPNDGNYRFNGSIDSVRFYTRALAQWEILNLLGSNSVLPEPALAGITNWVGRSLDVGAVRPTGLNSVFYAFTVANSGTRNFGLAEYDLSPTTPRILTLVTNVTAGAVTNDSYGMASVNLLNGAAKVLFTGNPDGQIFSWISVGATNALLGQLFSAQGSGKAWHGLSAVKTLEPGEGLVGLLVDPTNKNSCQVIFWPPEQSLPISPSALESAPSATVLPSNGALGPNAVITNRLWDNEGNASTPFLQYEFLGATNWNKATITSLDGLPYNATLRVAALPTGSNHTLTWNALGDVGANVVTNVLLRSRAQDFMLTGDWSLPTPFQLNTTIASNPTNSPINFTSITPVPGGLAFSWQGSSSTPLYLQRSPAVAGTNANWINIWTGAPPVPPFGTFTDFFGTNVMEYYRLKIGSP